MGNFEEYIRQGEPNKAEKAKVWKTVIGLQQGEAMPCLKHLPEQCFWQSASEFGIALECR